MFQNDTPVSPRFSLAFPKNSDHNKTMGQKNETRSFNIPLRYWLLSEIKKTLPYLYNNFFSILIFICLCISHNFFPSISNRINNYPNIDTLFIASGGMLSAIATLTISLAIIPIQRAIEIFSPTVRRNYINDIIIQGIIIGLGVFIFASFFLLFIDVQNNWKLYVQIEIIAISLDLIRWHFRRISFLLEPYNAIKSLSKKICSLINKIQRKIAINSYNELKRKPRHEWSPELLKQIELQYYKFFEGEYVSLLNYWIGELEDIVLRAIARSEKLTVKHGINSIIQIVCKFLDSRKANFQLYPVGFMTFGSDLDNIINPAYEKLLNICRLAIHNKDEQSGIQVVQALSYIAIKTTELKGYNEYSTPLTGFPLGYLGKCAELSYKSDLDEIPWNVINEFPKISEKAPDNSMIDNIHMQVLGNLSSIAQYYFLTKKEHMAKQAISNMCRVAYHLIKHNHHEFRTFLSLFFDKLKDNLPYMLLSEKPLDIHAFPPYSMANEFSLGHIVSVAASHIKTIQDKQWVNPYRGFIELNKEIFMHFRNLAEQYDIQKSFLSWQITDTIKYIAKVYLNVAKQKLTNNPKYNDELINQVGWYQSFFWVMFDKRKEVDAGKAEKVSDAMAVIGLQFANAEYYKIADNSIVNICSVAKDYIEKTGSPNEFSIADILICAWQLRRFAEYKNNDSLVKKSDEEIQKIVCLASQKQVDINKAFETRKQQLEEHLQDYTNFGILNTSEDYLRYFLQGNASKENSES